MKYTVYTVLKHNIIKVDYLSDEKMLQHAYTQAQAKAPHTHRNNPSARRRTEQEVFNSQYLGTIADIACSVLLQKHLDKYGTKQLLVERYDDIRSDNFRNADQFDARVILGDENRILTEIEIRSSVCNRVSLARMLEVFDVLGWYTTANKPGEQKRDFYMRPVYHYNKYQTGQAYAVANAEQYLLNDELDLYIVGGATADILQTKGEIQRGFGLLQEGATYQVVDILDALDAPAFLDTVLKFCEVK